MAGSYLYEHGAVGEKIQLGRNCVLISEKKKLTLMIYVYMHLSMAAVIKVIAHIVKRNMF